VVGSLFSDKCKKIKLVATDIDGVWTDGSMYYGENGEVQKRFSTYDGFAVQNLREAGIEVAVLTGENSPAVTARMKKLKIEYYFPAEQKKLERINELCEKLGLELDEVAFIGDDLNDLKILPAVGLSAMACNSPVLDLFVPDYITTREGGNGAFRDFSDKILTAKGLR
jgi:YrbI family 3-deoxy-D-manno-octulosonate 8-phosphate phosphatase